VEGFGGKVETVLEGRTEKPEASLSSESSPRPNQAGEEEPEAGGGGTVLVSAPEVGACVASGPGSTESEASAEEICSVIVRR
jgi:hypothetical protein